MYIKVNIYEYESKKKECRKIKGEEIKNIARLFVEQQNMASFCVVIFRTFD
jgi:hypothetical protein